MLLMEDEEGSGVMAGKSPENRSIFHPLSLRDVMSGLHSYGRHGDIFLIYHMLLGGLEHVLNLPFHIWDAILPIDELHHFSRWLKRTTNQ